MTGADGTAATLPAGPGRMISVIGLRGPVPFDAIVADYMSEDGDVLLLDPGIVCGRDHVVSAVLHAERAFREGRQRSKSLLTEIILYVACERQIGNAMRKVRPEPGGGAYVACVLDVVDHVPEGMVRDDSLYEASAAKLARLGITADPFSAPSEQILEAVAMVDLLKQ